MLSFPFYLTAIFTQVYDLYGTNSSISVTSTETSLLLQWPITDFNATYNVMYGVASNFSDVNNSSATIPGDNDTDFVHLIKGLYPGQQYSVELQKDGVLIFKDFVATRPLPVVDLQSLSPTTTSANITWSSPSNSIQDKYQVLVTGVTNTSFTLESTNVTDTWYLLDGLDHSSHYSVRVVAYSHGEPSNQSEPLVMNTAPLPPTDLIVIAIDTRRLNISWTPDPTSVQDSFRIGYVYNSTEGNEVMVNVTCSRPFCEVTMPGAAGQVYEITVYSLMGDVISEGVTTLHSTIPLSITSLEEVISNDTSIHLRWTSPESTDSHFRHFVIHVNSAFGRLSWEKNGDQRELIVTDLNVGSMYNVTVYVSTGYEISPAFEKVFYTYPLQIDSVTYDTSRDATTNSFTVHWTINETATIDNFIINISPQPDNYTFPLPLPADVSNFTFLNLSAGHAYLVSVITLLSTKQSDPVTGTFRTLPKKPETVTATVVSSTEVRVDWLPPGGSVDDYRLVLANSSNVSLKTVTVTGVSHDFLNLYPGTTYTVTLTSQSGGLYSEAVTQSVITNPKAVTAVSVDTVDSSSVNITWEAPNNTNFDQYKITIDPAGAVPQVYLDRNLGELEYSFQQLRPGQLYTVSVFTVTGSVDSERMAARAVTNPLAVTSLQAEAYKTGLMVSWTLDKTSQQSGFVVTYQMSQSHLQQELPALDVQAEQYDYSVEIPDLFPGGSYTVKVQAWQNVSGESAGSVLQEVNGTATPKPVENLTAELISTDVLDLDWTADSESRVNHYIIKHRPSLRNADALWVENSTYGTNLTLRDLFPGERYEIEVYAVSDGVYSEVRIVHVVVVPLPPQSVDVLKQQTTKDSVTLQWMYDSSTTYVETWNIRNQDNSDLIKTVSRPSTATIIEAVVDGLVAGVKYNLTVQAVVQETQSSDVIVYAVTKPLNNLNLQIEMVPKPTNTSFKVTYDVKDKDYFDSIFFHLAATNTNYTKVKADTSRFVRFSGLEAGTLYTVEVHTVSGGETSESKVIQGQTRPNPPTVKMMAGSSTFTLTIQHPAGGVKQYKVMCYSPDNLIVKDATFTAASGDQDVLVDMLQSFTSYRCEVTSIFKQLQTSVTKYVLTLEDAPSVVRSLQAQESEPLEVTLTWLSPEFPNGVVNVYMINYRGVMESDVVEGSVNATADANKQKIPNLKAGYTYTFYIRAVTITPGNAASTEIKLRTYKPPYKDGVDEIKAKPTQVSPKISPVEPHSLFFNFSNVFSDKFGEIIQYTVIITEDKDWDDIENNSILPGWKTARGDPAVKAYQVISNCSTFFEEGSTCDGTNRFVKRAANQVSYRLFEIGAETGCENRYYCNGPLKPDTTYFVSLRAYTTMQHSDTPFSEPIKTAKIVVPDEDSNVGGIVAGVLVPIILIAVIVFVVLFLRRRVREKSTMYRQQSGQQLTPRSSLSHRKSISPVPLSDFKEHVRLMKADSDFRYAEQFEDLKEIGRGQSCNAAELPCNRGKNRFTNILPYDHSRVKLLPIDDDEGSDYINANYVPGYSSKREYVVCQGPLPSTRDDFWRLLWEQNCRNIVMLTKCSEKGREKCDHYWPNGSDAVFYGDLQVAALNETLFPDWTITEFKVSLGDQSRQIRHFHFTSWPDFGVPKKEQVLVRFVRMVREKLMKDGGPIIVHCSAGVGRSGTFVVLDRLLQHIKTHSTIDIFSCVAELRRERVWMVQTEQQYICIHNSILCVLEGREDEHIYGNIGHSNIAFEDDEGVDLN